MVIPHESRSDNNFPNIKLKKIVPIMSDVDKHFTFQKSLKIYNIF